MNEALDLSLNPPSSKCQGTGLKGAQLHLKSEDLGLVEGLVPLNCGAEFLQTCTQSFEQLPPQKPPHSSSPSTSPVLPPLAVSSFVNGLLPLHGEGHAIDLSARLDPCLPIVFPFNQNLSLQIFQTQSPINGNLQMPLLPPFNPEAFRTLSMASSNPVTTTTITTNNNNAQLPGASLLEVCGGSQTSSSSAERNDLLKKYSSFHECGNPICRTAGNREHYHCSHCNKVINRREETIRHMKWHKKREESLQHGFMRYSPSDDCGVASCIHNLKQTHYHCLRANCSKIYISTSDVQMHANYHRKDAVILQEGFQRFRAAEDCGKNDCPFSTERTTHFHCRRQGCSFTFKNKADMEKHKNHHQKNDSIAKDGFRKFTKYEHCKFPGCKCSGVMNHIHCVRPGCDYIVHSASQISSHKRKHERRKTFNFQGHISRPHSVHLENTPGEVKTIPITTTPRVKSPQLSLLPLTDSQVHTTANGMLQRASRITEMCWHIFQDSGFKPGQNDTDFEIAKKVVQEVIPSLRFFDENESCENEQCSLSQTGIGHFHCFRTGCTDPVDSMDPEECLGESDMEYSTVSFGDMYGWKGHWCNHAWQSILKIIGFTQCSGNVCNVTGILKDDHVHCNAWPNCTFTSFSSSSSSTKNLPALARHLARHDYRFATFQGKDETNLLPQESSLTPRKRGRPLKHSRDIHVPRLDLSPKQCHDPNPHMEMTMGDFLQNESTSIAGGAKFYYSGGPRCVDRYCPFYAEKRNHFHCLQPRCHLATASLYILNTHRREFHTQVHIESGYDYFDRSIDCRRHACYAKRDTNHFHCLRPRCTYSFVRVAKMHQHTAFHEGVGDEPSEDCSTETHLQPSHNSPPLLPPLGFEKDGIIPDLLPFLINFIREQIGPMKIDGAASMEMPPGSELLKFGENEEKMGWTLSSMASGPKSIEQEEEEEEEEEEDEEEADNDHEDPQKASLNHATDDCWDRQTHQRTFNEAAIQSHVSLACSRSIIGSNSPP